MLVCPSVLPTWPLSNEASHRTLDIKIILLETQPKENYFLPVPEISIIPRTHTSHSVTHQQRRRKKSNYRKYFSCMKRPRV